MNIFLIDISNKYCSVKYYINNVDSNNKIVIILIRK